MTGASDKENSTWASRAALIVLCLISVVSSLLFGAVDLFVFTFINLFLGIVVLLWAADAWKLGEIRYSREILLLPLIGIVILGLIQMLPLGDPGISDAVISPIAGHALSVDVYATRLFLFKITAFIIFFAAALRFLDSRKRITYVSFGLIGFGAVSAFFAILQALSGAEAIYGVRPTPQAIFFGYFVNRHHFATLMIMCGGPALAMLLGSSLKNNAKLLVATALIIMALAIVFTGSRGGIISLIAMAGYVFVAKRRIAKDGAAAGGRKFVAFAAVAAFVLIVLGISLSLGFGDSLLRGTGLTAAADDPSNGRFGFWATSLRIFLAHPFIGSGLGSYGTAYPLFDVENGLYRLENAHNDYLQMLAEGGMIGLGLVIAFIALLFRRHFTLLRTAKDKMRLDVAIGAFGGIVGVLIHSFFDFPLRTNSNVFIFLLLVVIAVANVSSSSQRSSDRNG